MIRRYFIYCLLLFSNTVLGQSYHINTFFEHISKEEGLLHAHVLCIYEDNRGYIWIGTFGGLHRYDGVSFDYYTHNDTLPNSLSNNGVHSVFQDSKSRMWIGTESELNLFVPENNTFKKVQGGNALFKNYSIRKIIEDKNGLLWIATYGGGIAVVDPEKMLIIKWYREQSNDLTGNFANEIYRDKNNNIWAGLEANGLQKYNPQTDRFEKQHIALADQTINSIVEDHGGILWIGTWLGGLSSYNPQTNQLKNFSYRATDNKSIPAQNVRQISIDKDGMLWLATSNGLGYFNPEDGTCYTFRNSKLNLHSLALNYLWSVYADKEGIIWIGTHGNGLCKLDPHKNNFEIFDGKENSGELTAKYIECMFRDSKNRLWIGPEEGGVIVYSNNVKEPLQKQLIKSFTERKLRCFFEDHAGNIWIGCEDGIIKYTTDLKKASFIQLRKTGLTGFSIFSICEDANENLWFGGWNTGIVMLPSEKKSNNSISLTDFHLYSKEASGANHIPTNIIWCIHKDLEGRIWVGSDNYLLQLNEKTKTFKTEIADISNVFGISEYPKGTLWFGALHNNLVRWNPSGIKTFAFPHLSSDITIYTITSAADKIWMGTGDGLYSFDTAKNIFSQYTTTDGLPSNTFIRSSATSLADQSLLMGTSEGMIHFYPSIVSTSLVDPDVRISDISLFNHSISIEHSRHPLLNTALPYMKELVLKPDQDMVTIDFSAIQHSLPSKIHYVYKLDGFQNNWIEADKNRKAIFTNLNPGNYIFRVRTLLSNGSYGSHEASFKLVVLPPWWKTWWFRIICIILVAGSLIAFFILRTRTIRLRNKWLSDEIKQRTSELTEANIILSENNDENRRQTEKIISQQKELLDKKYSLEKKNEQLAEWNEFQNKLIAVLGHDLRGPLQNFSLLLEHMDEDSSEWALSKLKESAGSISELTTDLLDWITLQSNNKELQIVNFTWSAVLEKIVKETEVIRKEKNITFSLQSTTQEAIKGVIPIAHAALRNVLSNAIRYSKQNGIIELETNIHKDGHIGLRITDYGEGFDAIEVNKLIKGAAFHGMKERTLNGGAGLGLAICYDMIKRIDGWIEAASLPGSGATFYIFLPAGSDSSISETVSEKSSLPVQADSIHHETILKGKKILIVDDDDDIRWTLVKALSNYVEIYELRSGEEAMMWLKDHSPDLALLDINMPGISGLDLCKTIKNSPDLSHIPCMIISAETGDKIRSSVFAAGADSFLSKPFHTDEVLMQLSTYFENQEKKLKRFFNEIIPVDQISDNPINKAFLNQLIEIVEANLSSGDLNVDFLAKQTGLSRSSLYRNLKNITGQTVNDFIKNIRMRKSMILLKEGNLNISEIAMDTGFNSLSYFTTTFKKHFGYSPTEFKH